LPDGTKNHNLGIFWRGLELNIYGRLCSAFYDHREYLRDIWYILWSFGIDISSHFGKLYQVNSGNPGLRQIGTFCVAKTWTPLCRDAFLRHFRGENGFDQS
jgi:hypothetical protein